MAERQKHDKKLQGNTTAACNYALHQIKDAENKFISEVIHDAAMYYTTNHPAVQKSVKHELNMTKLNDKMSKLTEISSKQDGFQMFESNFTSFCMNLNRMKNTDQRKSLLIEDLKTLLTDIKQHSNSEFEDCMKIANKMLSQKLFDSIFTNTQNKMPQTNNALTKQKHDRKELSTGQYKEKYKD